MSDNLLVKSYERYERFHLMDCQSRAGRGQCNCGEIWRATFGNKTLREVVAQADFTPAIDPELDVAAITREIARGG